MFESIEPAIEGSVEYETSNGNMTKISGEIKTGTLPGTEFPVVAVVGTEGDEIIPARRVVRMYESEQSRL